MVFWLPQPSQAHDSLLRTSSTDSTEVVHSKQRLQDIHSSTGIDAKLETLFMHAFLQITCQVNAADCCRKCGENPGKSRATRIPCRQRLVAGVDTSAVAASAQPYGADSS